MTLKSVRGTPSSSKSGGSEHGRADRIGEATVIVNVSNEPRATAALNILHCLRAPVGGLFRHVVDLATAQAAQGHRVGVVCAATGDSLTEVKLLAFAPVLRLGLHKLSMARDLGLADLRAWRQVVSLAGDLRADILHGHGAKGGAYARLAKRGLQKSRSDLRCFYTPHGGSLHYSPTTLAGQFYGALERRLEIWTDGILFESQFAAQRYAMQIGSPQCATKVVKNGLLPSEFTPVETRRDAADFIFVGELRMLKGVDVALDALAIVNQTRRATAVFVGDGPDAAQFKRKSVELGLGARVAFPGAMRAREAFAMGRVMLMPSRAESLPYVVLEAVAAGLPVLATNVGGIPEIIAMPNGPLLPPGDARALAGAMMDALDHPVRAQERAMSLRASVRQTFSVATMAGAITGFYTSTSRLRRAA